MQDTVETISKLVEGLKVKLNSEVDFLNVQMNASYDAMANAITEYRKQMETVWYNQTNIADEGLIIHLKFLRYGVQYPELGTEFAAGYDLFANLNSKIAGDRTYKAEFDEMLGKIYPNYMVGTNPDVNFDITLNRIEIKPDGRFLIPTGFAMQLPIGYEAQIRPRSGLALKEGLMLVNSPGTIDADYRGEVGVIVINNGNHTIYIEHGQRIAQMVISKHEVISRFELRGELAPSVRGAGGFGHTGK